MSNIPPEFRYRVNLSESAKGLWQRDVTLEVLNKDTVTVIKNKADLGDVEIKNIPKAIWDLIDGIEREGNLRGRTMADNQHELLQEMGSLEIRYIKKRGKIDLTNEVVE